MKNVIASLITALVLLVSIAPGMAGESSGADDEYFTSQSEEDGC